MKTLKYIIFAILVFASSVCSNMQGKQQFDTIIKLNNTAILGKVLKVTDNTVEFDPQGNIPFIIILRDSIDMIVYSDGTVVKFDQSQIGQRLSTPSLQNDKYYITDENNNKINELTIIGPTMLTAVMNNYTQYNLDGEAKFVYRSDNEVNNIQIKASLSTFCMIDSKGVSILIVRVAKPFLYITYNKLLVEFFENSEKIYSKEVICGDYDSNSQSSFREFDSISFKKCIIVPQLCFFNELIQKSILDFKYRVTFHINVKLIFKE